MPAQTCDNSVPNSQGMETPKCPWRQWEETKGPWWLNGLWYLGTDERMKKIWRIHTAHTYKHTLGMYVYIQCPHVYNIQETPGDFCAHTSPGGGRGPEREAGSSGAQHYLDKEEERSEPLRFEEVGGVSFLSWRQLIRKLGQDHKGPCGEDSTIHFNACEPVSSTQPGGLPIRSLD